MAKKRKHASGISDAAVKGARKAARGRAAPDAKTVNPDRPQKENEEVNLGGSTVAFPAPSAQPTVRKAEIDIESSLDEDEDAEWRRAGGDQPPPT